jgi:hypothetical protein
MSQPETTGSVIERFDRFDYFVAVVLRLAFCAIGFYADASPNRCSNPVFKVFVHHSVFKVFE